MKKLLLLPIVLLVLSGCGEPKEFREVQNVYEDFNNCLFDCQYLDHLKFFSLLEDDLTDLRGRADYIIACKLACHSEYSRVQGNVHCIE